MIRIALAQINPTVGDFGGNLRKILTFARDAHRKRADLVIFPELCLPGYPPEDLLLKPAFRQANQVYLRKLAAAAPDINLICGYAGMRGKEVYNSAAVISGGKVVLTYDKIFLPNYGVFDEKRYFSPGTAVPVLTFGPIKIGFNICEDIWVAPGVCSYQAAMGARLILNLSSSPYHLHKLDERTELLRGRARHNKCYIAYVNTVGGQDELVFDGGSLVVDPTGKVISRARQFVEQLLIVDLPLSRLTSPPHADSASRQELAHYSVVMKQLHLPRRRIPRTRTMRRVAKRMNDAEEVYAAIVLGTKDYITKNGFKKVIIALSGGIDSALTLAVAVAAVGAERVDTLFMPSKYTSPESHKAAVKQARLLGVNMKEIAIDDLFAAYLSELEPHFKGKPEDVTEENLQARIRGNILMAFSNKFGLLVLNTANKSEAAVGYSTLYGDMVGGFAVLRDIPKTMVYKICRYLNRSAGKELIAREIIRRPPSAELKADQLDSDSLPPYEILDKILKLYVEQDKNIDEIIELGYDRKLVERVAHMVIRAEYKRRQMAPGVKITPRAFGKDRRWPITNKF
jgi:NAD+ synthase (glutamine-hydrolysing)